MSTETITMTDLVKGFWSADDDEFYEGFAHSTKTWNGFRVCYFSEEVMQKIVEDVSEWDATFYLTIEGTGDDEVVLEVCDDGTMTQFATLVTVDGVRLWDTWNSGWTWTEAINMCSGCGAEFPVVDLTDETRVGYDPVKVLTCKDCLHA